MASHYVSLARGVDGTKSSDFTTGTSSTAGDLFELRVLDGVTPKNVEVIKALEAFRRFFENPKLSSGASFDVAS